MTEASAKKMFRIVLWAAALIVLAYLLFLIAEVLIIFAISVLLAFIFEPFVSRLEREGFNRLVSTLATFIAFGFLLYFSFSILIPNLLLQMKQLIDSMHVYSLHDQLILIEIEIYKFLPFFNPGDLAKRVEEFLSTSVINSFDRITEVLSSIFSVMAVLVIVPFITFFLLKDSKSILRGIISVMPNKYFELSYWITKKLSMQLGKYVRAWIFDASFVGITMGVGLYIIGIENALPLGLIAGIGHLVPYFGPIIGGVPAIIISLMQYGDFSHAPAIIILLLGIYTVDNGFVQPYVFSKSLNIHPILIILLIITGSQLFGIAGMLLAIPAATLIKTAAKEIYFAYKNYNISRI
jgi:putative permease